MDIREAIRLRSSVRVYTDRAVDEAVVRDIMEAAIMAPNGGNAQPWDFILVDEPAKRKEMADLVNEAHNFYFREGRRDKSDKVKEGDAIYSTLYKVPLLIVACLNQKYHRMDDDYLEPEYFWDIQSGNRTWKDLVDIQNVNRVSSFPERIVKFSLDSKTIAIGEGTMLRIWDVFTGEPVDLYFTHQSVVDTLTNVKDIAFRPNGNILAVGYDNGSLIFWDSATRKSIGEPILVGMGVNAIAFSPNGNTLASGDLSGTVSLWDVVTHEQVGQLRKAEDFLPEVVNIAFSSNGRLLASVDGSGAVTLWNVKTLEQIAAPRLDTNNAVLTVIFTPDNSTLISGSSGGTVMMWDMSSRQPIGELIGHTNAVNLISINPDGNLAVTSDAGGAMFLWDISIHSWVDKACGMVSRNLSQVEWQQYFPDEEYRITCPQWPAGE